MQRTIMILQDGRSEIRINLSGKCPSKYIHDIETYIIALSKLLPGQNQGKSNHKKAVNIELSIDKNEPCKENSSSNYSKSNFSDDLLRAPETATVFFHSDQSDSYLRCMHWRGAGTAQWKNGTAKLQVNLSNFSVNSVEMTKYIIANLLDASGLVKILHASISRAVNRVWLLVGESGAGKTTIGLMLNECGAQYFIDDSLIVSSDLRYADARLKESLSLRPRSIQLLRGKISQSVNLPEATIGSDLVSEKAAQHRMIISAHSGRVETCPSEYLPYVTHVVFLSTGPLADHFKIREIMNVKSKDITSSYPAEMLNWIQDIFPNHHLRKNFRISRLNKIRTYRAIWDPTKLDSALLLAKAIKNIT